MFEEDLSFRITYWLFRQYINAMLIFIQMKLACRRIFAPLEYYYFEEMLFATLELGFEVEVNGKKYFANVQGYEDGDCRMFKEIRINFDINEENKIRPRSEWNKPGEIVEHRVSSGDPSRHYSGCAFVFYNTWSIKRNLKEFKRFLLHDCRVGQPEPSEAT